MPTQRPFFSNFLAAFRAHSALKSSPTVSSVSTSTTTSNLSPQSTHLASQSSQPSSTGTRSISASTTTKAPTALSPNTTAGSVSAAFSPPQHTHTPSNHQRHPSNIPVSRSPGSPLGSAAAFGGRARRGSDSSSEGGGFREVLGGEKWFIGGRTAGGEERLYQLGMVRRARSGDRGSLDRMSL